MFLVLKANGSRWDGQGWSSRGKSFCSVGRVMRSLHEEGEDMEGVLIVPVETDASQCEIIQMVS
jgi:hypothetical protein